jgi:thymidine kinase
MIQEMNMHPHLKLILGPMFAGKSSYLLAEERKCKIAKRSVVCVKHALDQRYTEGTEIVTHNRHTSSAPSYASTTLTSIFEHLLKYDVILIDEGQFFVDLLLADELVTRGKYVVVAGLSSDFKRESFESIHQLYPKADYVIQLNAICTKCGSDAPFTCRTKHESSSDLQTLVGGVETYEPRCRTCFSL